MDLFGHHSDHQQHTVSFALVRAMAFPLGLQETSPSPPVSPLRTQGTLAIAAPKTTRCHHLILKQSSTWRSPEIEGATTSDSSKPGKQGIPLGSLDLLSLHHESRQPDPLQVPDPEDRGKIVTPGGHVPATRAPL